MLILVVITCDRGKNVEEGKAGARVESRWVVDRFFHIGCSGENHFDSRGEELSLFFFGLFTLSAGTCRPNDKVRCNAQRIGGNGVLLNT